MRRTVLGGEHPDAAESASLLAGILLERGEPARAESLSANAIVVQSARLPAAHWRLALTKSGLGACFVAARRFDEAESLLVSADAVLAKAPALSPAERRRSANRVAKLYEAWGRPAKH